jgi:hypothetical protein
MADLKPLWQNPPVPDVGLTGDGILKRGNDPNAEGGGGPNGLDPLWSAPVVPTLTSVSETPNSVSGLPLQPHRWEPSGEPPEPPDLTDRSPGTIDQK